MAEPPHPADDGRGWGEWLALAAGVRAHHLLSLFGCRPSPHRSAPCRNERFSLDRKPGFGVQHADGGSGPLGSAMGNGSRDAAHLSSSTKAADPLPAAGIAAILALPVVPTGRNDGTEPDAADRALRASAEFPVVLRPGDLAGRRQLGIVPLGLQRAPECLGGLPAHGIEMRHATPPLLVVVVCLSGGCRGQEDLGSMQPSTRALFERKLPVTLAQVHRAHRRIAAQPGQFAKLGGVDLMRADRVVRQRTQTVPTAPGTALSADVFPEHGRAQGTVSRCSRHRSRPRPTRPGTGTSRTSRVTLLEPVA